MKPRAATVGRSMLVVFQIQQLQPALHFRQIQMFARRQAGVFLKMLRLQRLENHVPDAGPLAQVNQLAAVLTGLPLFDPDFNNFQYFGFYKWCVCKGYPARRRSKGLVVQTYPVSIGGVLCIIMSHHVSQTFIPS
jgi:hypothetical protein